MFKGQSHSNQRWGRNHWAVLLWSISHLAFFKNLSRWPSHPGKVGSLPRRPSWPGKVENYWPIQGPNQIWLHLWTCSGYSGIQAHLLPLPIPSATVYVSPLHIIINSLMSFHVTIFFYSYLAFLQFSPFLKGLSFLPVCLNPSIRGGNKESWIPLYFPFS